MIKYVEEIYDSLKYNVLFSKAKEYSWQTFFHHSVSVGCISYRIGKLIKSISNKKQTISSLYIKKIEDEIEPLSYEDLLFIGGVIHDYIKIYGRHKEAEARELINNFSKLKRVSSERRKWLTDLALKIARATESISSTELSEHYINYVVKVVNVADRFMSLRNIDEAIAYIVTNEVLKSLERAASIKFGFIKISTPSLLYAIVSKKIMDKLTEHGWVPIAAYSDGVVFVGSSDTSKVPIDNVSKLIMEELSTVFGDVKGELRDLAERVRFRVLGRLIDKLLETKGRTELPVDIEEINRLSRLASRSRRDLELFNALRISFYHNLVVKYLRNVNLKSIQEEFNKLRRPIDVRTFATGYRGKGSVFFEDLIKILGPTKKTLTDALRELSNELDDHSLITLVSFIIAFLSKDVKKVSKVLSNLFNVSPPEGLKQDLIRCIAIAEVFRHRSKLRSNEFLTKLVDSLPEYEGVDLTIYVNDFIMTSIMSNVIEIAGIEGYRKEAEERMRSAITYCRVCRRPIYHDRWRFIEYAQKAGGVGGASEIWLSDDPPLANLEDIAGKKGIRHICPFCLYEASKLGGKIKAPYMVVALHPVIAYDVLEYIKDKVSSLVNISVEVSSSPSKIARNMLKVIYLNSEEIKEQTEVFTGPQTPNEKRMDYSRKKLHLKVSKRDALSAFIAGKAEERLVFIYDALGARLIMPLQDARSDHSLKRKHVAKFLVITPLIMSLMGGGQVALVGNVRDIVELGTQRSPVIVPYPINLVNKVISSFERIIEKARREHREPTLEEYNIYGQQYVVLMLTLFGFAMKVLGWYSRWRAIKGGVRRPLDDYALDMLTFMDSIPHVPLAILSPPPESLEPRRREERERPLPYFSVLTCIAQEVESLMPQIPELNKALFKYAANLKELSGPGLSRYKVQTPLRRSIYDVLITYARVIGENEALSLATDKYIDILETVIGRKLSDKQRAVFISAFKDIASTVLTVWKEVPPGKFRKFIEVLLDSVYEKYKTIKIGEKT